ncbi:MAG: hypothetical protein PHI49_12575 [Halothiobacillaceae bacterium]|jgi:hypothetical protein|nr:hypothetical protein [Halothiobacillaceae bacterium]MDY0049967.1 hypothetical protein [Halothiobacillaceae bacterium]
MPTFPRRLLKMSLLLAALSGLGLASLPVQAGKLVVDTSQVCGGVKPDASAPEELAPLLRDTADGWSLQWKATCFDMGGQMFGMKVPRTRTLGARYTRGKDAVAVTLVVAQDPKERGGSILDMAPAAQEYSMVKPEKVEKIRFGGHEAWKGMLVMPGANYRQDVLDVMLSPHARLSIQREYESGSAMDMAKWAEAVIDIKAFSDPAWLKGGK